MSMKIPTKKQCYQLMCEMQMMDHIVVHSLQVCRVATLLTKHLNKVHDRLNLDLIRSAALLHDITKTRSFKTREDHALTGGEFLSDSGYPEIGDLIRQHVKLDKYSDTGTIEETEVLNYADKRVLHDEIVVLDRRLDYILERYAETPAHRERIRWIWERTRELEAKVFDDLSFGPEDLNRLLNSEDLSKKIAEYQKTCNLHKP